VTAPGWVGWWALCGDGPCDYISAASGRHPREALRAFARQWTEVASYMRRGERHPTIDLGTPASWPTLAPLLLRRAELLQSAADDDSEWEDDDDGNEDD
jgi:hypothetical protein